MVLLVNAALRRGSELPERWIPSRCDDCTGSGYGSPLASPMTERRSSCPAIPLMQVERQNAVLPHCFVSFDGGMIFAAYCVVKGQFWLMLTGTWPSSSN